MNLFKNKFFKSDLVKNGFTLLSASSLSQLIALAVYPIVTRQYSPSDLGALSLFLSVLGISAILATGKYESAILLEKEDRNAASVFDLTVVINATLCLFIFAALLLFKTTIIRVFRIESIASFIWLIPIMVFLAGFGTACTYWFNRNNKFSLSARYYLAQSTSNSAIKVAFGAFGATQWGLIVANFLAQLVAVGSILLNQKSFSSLFKFDKKRMKEVAIRQSNFPIYTLPHAFINTFANNLPILILSAWFNMAEVGLFSLGITLGLRPITVFTESINQVFFQKVTSNLAKGVSSYSMLILFCKKVLWYGLPVFLPIFFFIKEMTVWVFGEAWAGSGVYSQMMMPMFFITIMTSSLSFIPTVVGKQSHAMVFEILYDGMRILSLFVGIWLQNIHTTVLLYSVVSSVFLLIYLAWVLWLAKKNKL
jgi:O-antigen/teichoic acid export membrane protein